MPYAKGYAISEHYLKNLGMAKKDLKNYLPNYYPSKAIREARAKQYGSGITKEEYGKVLNKKNNLKDFETIAISTGYPVQRVEEIIEAAKSAHKHVSTPLKGSKKVLVLDADSSKKNRSFSDNINDKSPEKTLSKYTSIDPL